jgi:hypothetical protein
LLTRPCLPPGTPRPALLDSTSGATSGAAAERPLNHPPPPPPPPPPAPSPTSRAPLSPPPQSRLTSYARAMAARVALSMSPSHALSEPSVLLALCPSLLAHRGTAVAQPPAAAAPTKGNIPLGLMQISLSSRLNRTHHERHIKDESSHQTGDAAFTPATP